MLATHAPRDVPQDAWHTTKAAQSTAQAGSVQHVAHTGGGSAATQPVLTPFAVEDGFVQATLACLACSAFARQREV